MPDLSALIEKLSAATEGSRELDDAIQEVAIPLGCGMLVFNGRQPPLYTTSLDAALSLVPEGWRIEDFSQYRNGDFYVCLWPREKDDWDDGLPQTVGDDAATPALALCVASLKARQHA
jgi:hypothetical protein